MNKILIIFKFQFDPDKYLEVRKGEKIQRQSPHQK